MLWSKAFVPRLVVCCLFGALAAGTIQAYRPPPGSVIPPPQTEPPDLDALVAQLDHLWRYGGEESITQDQINALLHTTLRSNPSPGRLHLADFQGATILLEEGCATLFIDHKILGQLPHQLSLKLKIREHPEKGRQLVINEGSIGRLPLRGLLCFPARSAATKVARTYGAELAALARLPVIEIEAGRVNLSGRERPDS